METDFFQHFSWKRNQNDLDPFIDKCIKYGIERVRIEKIQKLKTSASTRFELASQPIGLIDKTVFTIETGVQNKKTTNRKPAFMDEMWKSLGHLINSMRLCVHYIKL